MSPFAVGFLTDTDFLVMASADETVRVWDRASGEQIAALQSEGNLEPVGRCQTA